MTEIVLLFPDGTPIARAEIDVAEGDCPVAVRYGAQIFVIDPSAAVLAYRRTTPFEILEVRSPDLRPAKVEQTRTGARMDLADGETPAADVAALADAARGR